MMNSLEDSRFVIRDCGVDRLALHGPNSWAMVYLGRAGQFDDRVVARVAAQLVELMNDPNLTAQDPRLLALKQSTEAKHRIDLCFFRKY